MFLDEVPNPEPLTGKPEFTELEQWKREHYLFNAIIKIPVTALEATQGQIDVFGVNSHANATRIGWDLLEIDLIFCPWVASRVEGVI